MRQQIAAICILTITLLITGCSLGKDSDPASTPIPAVTLASTPAPKATPIPAAATQIETLCLQIDDSQFQYYDLEPLMQDLEHILKLADIQAMQNQSAGCDATLLVSLEGTPLSDEYLDFPSNNTWVTCFTGASVQGEMTLQQSDRQPVVMPISGREPVKQGTITTCPSAADAPFYDISMAGLLDGLVTFWGTEMLVYAQAVDSEGPGLNRLAMEALLKLDSERIVPDVINLLDTHPKASVRLTALTTLTEIGGPATEKISAIRQSLQDEDKSVREMALQALALIDPDAPEVVHQSDVNRALGELKNAKDENARIKAVRALGQLGADENVIQALIEAFEENEPVREAVASALANIGPETVPWLIEALGHEDWWVAEGSALALKKMGVDSEAAVPALLNCIATQFQPSTKWVCEDALLAIGPQAARVIVDLVTQGDTGCSSDVASFLNGSYKSNPEVRGAIPYLIDCLEMHPGTASYYQTLRYFSGEDFGDDIAAWRKWWSENR